MWAGNHCFGPVHLILLNRQRLNNQENIIIVDEMHLIERYRKQFEVLKQRLKGKEPIELAHKGKRILARNTKCKTSAIFA